MTPLHQNGAAPPLHLYSLLDQNVIVLTASRRLAHAVRTGYAHYAQAQGRAVWRTPRVLPWSVWLAEQWRKSRATQGDAQRRLLTRSQARILWRSVVADSKAGEHLLNIANAARSAERSWRALHDYLIPLEHVARFDRPEAQALHAWCAAFVRRCDELSAVDEAPLAAWAAGRRLEPEQPIALAGFDRTPPALARLADIWREQGRFAELASSAAETGDVRVVGARDASAEIELAARWARAVYEARGGAIGVLVPNLERRRHEVRRVFDDVFSPGARAIGAEPSHAPTVIAASRPLSDYPLIDAAACVLRMADRGDAHLLGRILRSPFIAGGVSECDARARADFRLREEQRERWSWFELEHWGGATEASMLQRAARDILAVLRGEAAAAPPSRWVERFQAILKAAGWPGERALNSAEQQTFAKFQAALAELGALDVVLSRLTLRQALTQLDDLLRDTPFEPESPQAAVTIIDPQTASGMSFDALWLAGMDAERAPGPINPDPLIPIELQRAAGMPGATAEGVRQLAAAQLHRWLTSARSLVLSWARREGDAELEASPLVAHWPATDPTQIELTTARAWRVTLFEERPPQDVAVDEQAPPLAPGAARGGARTLELQSQCPFRAQAELRLHAKPTPEITVGLDPRQRGKILHGVLEELWRRWKEQRTLLEKDDAELAAEVRIAAERATASVLRVTTGHRARLAKLEVESVARHIMELLRIERARPPFRVGFAEAEQSYQIGGLSITLRPDRIDELANHGALLIDYKLGDSHTARHWLDEQPGRPRSPQLPLYALAHEHALEGLAFVTLAPGAVEYRGVSKSGAVGAGVPVYPGKLTRHHPPPDWAALIEYWRARLTRLAESYVRGEAPVDPLAQACTHCHLSTFCRIHERKASADPGGADE